MSRKLGRWGGASRGRRDASRSRVNFGTDGFNPLTFGPTALVAAWAEDPAWSHPANGAAVSSWRLAGSLGEFALETFSGTPVYRSSGFGTNSKPSVDFATNQSLVETYGSTISQPYSIVVVGLTDTVGTTHAIVDGIGVANRAVVSVNAAGLFGGSAGSAGSIASPAVAAATAFVGAVEFNGASGKLSLNGGALTTANMSTQTMTGMTVGENYTGAQDWVGEVAFVGVYSGAVLTSGALTALITGLKTYYGIA